ncbi:NAD(P)/FAD-dependent oxidoreductase [Verrucomicrobiota bacterium]
MGYQEITIKLSTDYTEEQLRKKIATKLRVKQFSYQIEKKSLDARKKDQIHWQLRVAVSGKGVKGPTPEKRAELEIPHKPGRGKAVVVGSGPAGFFAAFALQQAGYSVTLVERGADVDRRDSGITRFESTGEFSPTCNYAFGEGGAGTFSDGKLTSRSKHINKERAYILQRYIDAGAPAEIAFMTHPHLGSDNLKKIVKRLRQQFEELGGKVLFETMLDDLQVSNGRVTAAVTSAGTLEADCFVVAPGHSAYETYRMLMQRGVQFRNKNFAIGCRVEHPQELINQAQWGKPALPGVKAAEYRLTHQTENKTPVYTFCMCPGGIVVPAAAYEGTNIVNGMSLYQRDGQFANAACVSGVQFDQLQGRETDPAEALEWLETLERSFFDFAKGYRAPACTIQDFMSGKANGAPGESSHPIGLIEAPLWDLLPGTVAGAMQDGLHRFSRMIKGFETGNIMGLESKTSAPIQVLREREGRCHGFDNLYLVGEGSGYAGGIISSGADGIKAALDIITNS